MQPFYEVNCICGVEENKKNTKTLIKCNECKIWQHKECLKSMIKMRNYICPKCQIIKGGLFYNIIYTLLDPSLFTVENNKNNQGIYHFIPDIKMYPKIKKIQKNNPEFIIIRCLKFDKNGFSFHWPKMSKIYINDKLILDFTQKGQKKKDKMIALVSKKDFEKNGDEENFGNKNLLYDANIVIIEDYIFDKKQNRFEINVNYSQSESLENTNFAISINCCEILIEPNEIIKKVPIYHDKKILNELLLKNLDEDNNISSIKEKINLMDLYTESEKIKLPARGINCGHLNVFDLKTFLLLNRKTNKYQCPYCKRYANNLYIDGIILDFINDKNNLDVNEILIDINHNILSYLHQDNNKIVNNEKKEDISNKNHHKENFDLNKNFVIYLSQDGHDTDNTSYFQNKKFNIISNLGQIFEIIKKDKINNKNDKKHFINNAICLGKNSSKNNSKSSKNDNISKYPEINNNANNTVRNHKIPRIYDLNREQIENGDLFLPICEEEFIEENNENNKDSSFLIKKIKDSYINNSLHRNIFVKHINDNGINNNNNNTISNLSNFSFNNFQG